MDVDLQPVAGTKECCSCMEDCGVRDPESMVFGTGRLPTKRHHHPLPDAGRSTKVASEDTLPAKRTKHMNLITSVRATKVSVKASLSKRTKCKTSTTLETLKEHQTVKVTKVSVRARSAKGNKQKTATKPETLLRKRRIKTTTVSMKVRPAKGTKRKAGTKSETLVKKQRFETTKVSVKIVTANGSKNKSRPKPQTLMRKHQGKSKPKTLFRKHRGKTKPDILIRKTKGKPKMETLPGNRGAKTRLEMLTCHRGTKDNPEILKRRQGGINESMNFVAATKRRADTKLQSLQNNQRTRTTTVPVTVLKSQGTKRKTSTKPETLTRSQWLKATKMSMVQQAEKRLLTTTSQGSLDHKYQQLEKIGEGGFGSVYAGYRKADSFPVAIKHIPKHEVKIISLNIKGRKHDVPVEALLMLQASCIKDADGHSAVVSLLDKYDLDQELVLVMEKPARSVDLFTYITRCRLGHLKENEAKNIMRQLVDAAIKMHAVNVFHRDLKPGNILLEATYGVPRVRVIDFGCSCFVTEEPYHDYTGTLSYAPPEFVLRGTYRAGPTTVWHLGAMLFELLAGSKQFDTLLFISQMLQLNRVLSQDCRDFLHMCLHCDPEQRASLVQIHQHPWLI
ncbi:serine/threonine-protein kinase pim-1-like [Hippocampus comes]|uniref:serine/threonine-protein kinase pim-1-like n=1 Tax=Hippocampus comes TaxID=109280 RepID=UPI00094EE9F9|nr:PREDICTED: serine/threonine-protein kinase pim-1-like [Hippocampus comes]